MRLNLGSKWEDKAKKYMESKGYKVMRLDSAKTKALPDFMAIKKDHLVFVECKTSSGKVKLDRLQEKNYNQYRNLMDLWPAASSIYFILDKSGMYCLCPMTGKEFNPDHLFI